ncbi:hypothetical protein [Actinomadura sp. B10D3]|uniref:hypothetical protein n=1 Tax=Actinomadura sp. B10D3 TaxID=3153557 RepID=UPI00325F27E4
MQTMWTVDAVTDTGQLDAYLRAQPFLTSAYAAGLRSQPLGAVPASWRDHRAYAKVQLTRQPTEGGVGPDSAVLAHRQWRITVTPIGRDGWRDSPAHATAFVTLIRQGDRSPWKVNAVGTA